MNKNYTLMELEAIKKLCKCVNSVASLPTDLIADTNVATNTTYSSYRIDAEMSALENDIQRYVDTALAGLSRLTKEVIDDKALVVKENVLYLYKDPTDMNNDYMQMMLINGVAVELGSTTCDFSSVYSKDEIDDKFALKIDLDVLTTSFNNLVTTVDKKIDKDNIATVLDDTVTDEQVPSAKSVYEELDKKIEGDNVVKKDKIATVLDDTVTDDEVASAKAVYDELQEVFQSVSNGKQLVANAITDKGVTTSADDTFATMANNIEKISGGSETIPIAHEIGIINYNTGRKITIDISKNYIVITGLNITNTLSKSNMAQYSLINGEINTIIQSSSTYCEFSISENKLLIRNTDSVGYSMYFTVLEM